MVQYRTVIFYDLFFNMSNYSDEDDDDYVDQEIDKITQQPQILTLRLEKLRKTKQKKKNLKAGVKVKIKVGDTAQIINSYKGMKGTIGTVIKVTKLFGTIQTKDGTQIVRGLNNLLVVDKSKIKY